MRNTISLLTLWGVFLVPSPGVAQVPESPDRGQVVHLLNRTAYGPRPGDVEHVMLVGIPAYLDAQLEPESIDDTATGAALAPYSVLNYDTEDLTGFENERRQLVRRLQQAESDGPERSDLRAELRALNNRRREIGREFQQVALVRAVSSERQLYEVMVDFWTNHFNVSMAKGSVRDLVPAYVEHVIRPRALGSFRDLLATTAHSPAMLEYLDNVRSVAPGSEPPRLDRIRERIDRILTDGGDAREAMTRLEQARSNLPRGLNENYARELLELHTIGVDGGYTQDDVIAVARIFTGWTYDRSGEPSFRFNDWAHDQGEKTVLGRVFPANGGLDEGERLLDLLAAHPATMRFVSTKLCARFVNDRAPPGCVDAAVDAWTESEGDIASVVRAILTSPEFWDDSNYDAKIKTPLEFLASAMRALGARSDSTARLAGLLNRLGQPLYMFEAPTGYPEDSDAWVNSGALLSRMNSALALAARRIPGVHVAGPPFPGTEGGGDATITAIADTILYGRVTDNTVRVIRERTRRLQDQDAARTLTVGLLIGGPEFQRQ